MRANLFKRISGLNSVNDPVDIGYDPETGVSDAQVAVDCILTDRGRIGRAPGFVQNQSGAYHSLFCDGGDCFVGKTTSIYKVSPDKEVVGIRSGMSGERVSWAQVGAHTYYGNGTEKGHIEKGVSDSWAVGTYTGVDTDYFITEAPIPHHLAYGYSRLFIARDNAVFWNLEPGEYDKYVLDQHWMYPTKVVLLATVAGGVFVSDQQRTYFRQRTGDPNDSPEIIVANHPAYEWSMATEMVEGSEIGLEPGLCRLWVSPEGLICGTPNGQHINLTKEKIIYPEGGTYGACGLVGYHLYNAIQ
jgi:hypothetical protein